MRLRKCGCYCGSTTAAVAVWLQQCGGSSAAVRLSKCGCGSAAVAAAATCKGEGARLWLWQCGLTCDCAAAGRGGCCSCGCGCGSCGAVARWRLQRPQHSYVVSVLTTERVQSGSGSADPDYRTVRLQYCFQLRAEAITVCYLTAVVILYSMTVCAAL